MLQPVLVAAAQRLPKAESVVRPVPRRRACLFELSLETRFQDFGVAVFPSPKIVLKGTYQRVRNNDPAGANSDSILGGVGFFF